MELSENMSLEELGAALKEFTKLKPDEIVKFSDDWVKLLIQNSHGNIEFLNDHFTEEEIAATIKIISFSIMIGEKVERDMNVLGSKQNFSHENTMIILAIQFLLKLLVKKFQPYSSDDMVDELLTLNEELSQNISVEEWEQQLKEDEE